MAPRIESWKFHTDGTDASSRESVPVSAKSLQGS